MVVYLVAPLLLGGAWLFCDRNTFNYVPARSTVTGIALILSQLDRAVTLARSRFGCVRVCLLVFVCLFACMLGL